MPEAAPFRVHELASAIESKLGDEKLRLREAAGQIGISAATLSRVINGKLPDTGSFAALVNWLGVSADLFIAGPQRTTGPEAIEAHLRADRTLPPATASALAALVRAAYQDLGRPENKEI